MSTSLNLPPKIEIFASVRDGYIFVKENFQFLLKAAALPMIFAFLNYLGVAHFRPDATLFENFILTLPSTIFFAWYAFIQIRLQVFGETFTNLDHLSDEDYERRRNGLVACIGFYLLFQMFMTVISFSIVMIAGSAEEQTALNTEQTVGLILVTTLLLWALKFSVLHIVATAEGDIKEYIKRVKGFWFSYILLGIGITSLLPMALLFFVFLNIIIPDPASAQKTATFVVYSIGSIMTWMVISLLNASIVPALKQLYKHKDKKK